MRPASWASARQATSQQHPARSHPTTSRPARRHGVLTARRTRAAACSGAGPLCRGTSSRVAGYRFCATAGTAASGRAGSRSTARRRKGWPWPGSVAACPPPPRPLEQRVHAAFAPPFPHVGRMPPCCHHCPGGGFLVWPGAPGAARWCRDGVQQRIESTRLCAHVHGANLQDQARRASPMILCSSVASTARKPRDTGGTPGEVVARSVSSRTAGSWPRKRAATGSGAVRAPGAPPSPRQ